MITVRPTTGSMRTRYPDVRFSIRFYTQPPAAREIEAVALASESRVGRVTSDVLSCSVHKSISNPVGTWQASLVPRSDYLQYINPGDWAAIFGDNGDGLGYRLLCYGPVRSSRMSTTVGDKGMTQRELNISGCDYGYTLVKTSAIYDAQLQNSPTIPGLLFGSLSAKDLPPPSKPGSIVKSLIQYYFSSELPQLYDPRTSAPFGRSISLDWIDDVTTLGCAVPTQIDASTSLWQTLQQWANEGLNELFADYRPDFYNLDNTTTLYPSVILRQCPYWGSDWESLTTVNIDSDEIIRSDVGKSDDDVRNWVRAVAANGEFNGTDLPIGLINTDSIKKFGFCRHEDPNPFTYGPPDLSDSQLPGNSNPAPVNADIASILKASTALQMLWHHSNDKLLNGSMTLCFRPDIRVGYRLSWFDSLTSTTLDFYVESVEHHFSYPGASTTSVALTRGRDRMDPLFRYGLPELQAQGIIQDMGNTITETQRYILRGISR